MEGNNLILTVGGGAAMAASAVVVANDPTKSRSLDRPELANVDFRRGKSGEGRVLLTFAGDGAMADVRREGNKVVVELANVQVPAAQQQRLDVTDFATPVESIQTTPRGSGARMEIAVAGDFEQLAYQTVTNTSWKSPR